MGRPVDFEPVKFDLTFLRHGESSGNAQGLIQGQSDHPLTEKGIYQARALASFWQDQGISFDLIISSPLLRARQTAEEIANELIAPVEFDPQWMERGFGDIEDRPFDVIRHETPQPNFFHPYEQIGGTGESLVDLFNRASIGLQTLLRRLPGRYLIVSHGSLLNMTLYAILGLNPHNTPASPRFYFANTGYVTFSYDPVNFHWRMYNFNDNSHLSR
jgi:2,3-bisphosphoglycerate-dependent phosphoglycerate mutase